MIIAHQRKGTRWRISIEVVMILRHTDKPCSFHLVYDANGDMVGGAIELDIENKTVTTTPAAYKGWMYERPIGTAGLIEVQRIPARGQLLLLVEGWTYDVGDGERKSI